MSDPGWGQWTRLTLTIMTLSLTLVMAAVQCLGASLATGVMRSQSKVGGTQHLLTALTTEAILVHSHLTWLTVSSMACSTAVVLAAAQHPATWVVTHQLHLTLDSLCLGSAMTSLGNDGSAASAGTRVTQVKTGVGTVTGWT